MPTDLALKGIGLCWRGPNAMWVVWTQLQPQQGYSSPGTQPALEFHPSFMTRYYSGVDMGLKERIFKGRGVQLEVKWARLFAQVWACLYYFCYCNIPASFFTMHLTLIPLFILLNNSLCFYRSELHLSVQAGSCACVFSKFPAPLSSIASLLCDSLRAIKHSNALQCV